MASMYSAKVMEHFANPHNVGEDQKGRSFYYSGWVWKLPV